jgi:thiol-disulfide isomerase/thioredoxin
MKCADMPDPTPRNPSQFRIILLAALAGVLAGAAAIYVSGGFEGNPQQPPVAVANADDQACAAKADRTADIMRDATGQVAAMTAADPARSVKHLAFNDAAGKPMTIADRSGKVVLMNIWATWCAPCRAEMPELDHLQRTMGGDQFEVVAVNVDTGDDAKPKKFLEETGIASLGYYRDNTLKVFETLKKDGLALGLPVTLLIGADGCLLGSMNGPAAWGTDDAVRLIDAAILKSSS